MSQYQEWNIDDIKYTYRVDNRRHFSSKGPPTTCGHSGSQRLHWPNHIEMECRRESMS